jgi:membrane protease YdiL (CAAX protease family)
MLQENSNVQLNSIPISPRPAGIVKLASVSLLLFFSTLMAHRLTSQYLDNLVHKGQIGQWTRTIRYLDTASAIFVVLQMIFVGVAYRLGHNTIELRALGGLQKSSSLKPSLVGLVSGVAVYLLALPLLLRLDADVQFVPLILNNPFGIQSAAILILFIGILPIATEIGFRGIIFQTMQELTGVGAAVVVSSLLFAYVWSVFNPGTALLLGLATALLYRRYRQLMPAVVANATLTVLSILTLFLKTLYEN